MRGVRNGGAMNHRSIVTESDVASGVARWNEQAIAVTQLS